MQQIYSCPSCGAPVAFGVEFRPNCGMPFDWPTSLRCRKTIVVDKRYRREYNRGASITRGAQ